MSFVAVGLWAAVLTLPPAIQQSKWVCFYCMTSPPQQQDRVTRGFQSVADGGGGLEEVK